MTREQKNKLVKSYKRIIRIITAGWVGTAGFFVFLTLAIVCGASIFAKVFAILCILSIFTVVISTAASSGCFNKINTYRKNLIAKRDVFLLNLAITRLFENPTEYYENHRHLIKIIKSETYVSLLSGMIIASYHKSENEALVKRAENIFEDIKKW